MTSSNKDSFGAYLKTERELRQISLEEIAVTTKIKLEYLRALEEDRFEVLPNETFIRGYIRAYSKFCGLNEDDVLVNYEFFDQLRTNTSPDQIATPVQDDATPNNRAWIIGLLLLGTIALSFLLAYLFNQFSPP
ncbi:helix-turn-helix domain-containing protein [candidate division CSSED10-310 bacterium]|uniref:Helix-turn-helix domain-containing protein n=1 Tax=candidate division CSSED10-310 bacterium TaxID=2855610 RepID=A0ABV6YWR6_UNCC1